MENATDLEKNIDDVRKNVKTDSYPMSIGELASMYEKKEIILKPEYQRYFRWTIEQKSKLIESILIGLPLPSIFMAQDEEGSWEVVDGMQRLSTIFDFMGILSDEYKNQSSYKPFDKLSDDLFYLNFFSHKGWNDFPKRIQLDFKRSKTQLTILLRETSPDAKFELFQRLNSGGTSISGQELRNAILAGNKPEMLDWLENLSQNEDFVSVVALADSDISTRYDMELVLRFIVFLAGYGSELKNFNSVDVFLTHAMRELVSLKFEYEEKKNVFEQTFKSIREAAGDGALRYKTSPGTGKFSISFFEAVALGIAQNINNLPPRDELKEKIESIGNQESYKKVSGSGKNVKLRIPTLLELGREYFKK